MKGSTVSISEGKKGFSRLIENTHKKKEEIVVTKRGKPIAVIVPFEEYQRSKRVEGFRKILEAREIFLKTGLTAKDIFKESRKQLEKRS
jgi:prevent-host-death family protein